MDLIAPIVGLPHPILYHSFALAAMVLHLICFTVNKDEIFLGLLPLLVLALICVLLPFGSAPGRAVSDDVYALPDPWPVMGLFP